MTVRSPKSPRSPGGRRSSVGGGVKTKSAMKYGSKMTALCLDNVIARHVESAGNPQLAAKWMHKMKLSILRKVSTCSKTTFLSDAQQPSTLRAEIEREKETVNEKREKVLEAASEMMKKSKFDGVSGSDRTPGYEGGAFDGSIKNITGKLTKVAHDLNKTSKAVKSRLQSLQSTVEEVESEWKSKAGSKKASSKGQASPKRVVADSLTGSSKSAPLNRLHQHLNR